MAYDPRQQNINMLKHTIFKSFDFTGRSTTFEFFLYYLFSLFVPGIILFPFFLFSPQHIITIVSDILYIMFLIPFASLFVRRLHDINMSGWWSLPYFLGYLSVIIYKLYIGVPISKTININDDYVAFGLGIIPIIFCLYVVFKKGDLDRNRYGEPNVYEETPIWTFRFQ